MKKLIWIIPLLLLCSCKSEEEKKSEWIKFCLAGDFNAKQCEVLYSIKESGDDANTSANSAAAMSGVAIGMSAGRR